MKEETVKIEVNGVELAIPKAMLSVMVAENLESKGRNPYMPGEGIWVLVDGSKVDKGLFTKSNIRASWNQRDFQSKFRVAWTVKHYEQEKFYIMVPQMTWPAEEGKGLEEFEKIAKAYGGRIAYTKEVLLYQAVCISSGVPWETICDYRDKSPTFRVCRNAFQKLVLAGGSDIALAKGYHVNYADRPAYVINSVELPKNWEVYCAVPYIVIPYKKKSEK